MATAPHIALSNFIPRRRFEIQILIYRMSEMRTLESDGKWVTYGDGDTIKVVLDCQNVGILFRYMRISHKHQLESAAGIAWIEASWTSKKQGK